MILNETIFVIGGCRSGKSRHALETAEKTTGSGKTFIATCMPHDEEMRRRAANHRKERGESWVTVEEPLLLSEALDEHEKKSDVVLVDCLTLWISNLLLKNDEFDIFEQVGKLVQSIEKTKCPVILVSNEVGTGIVPENNLARAFRDFAGHANQAVAACCCKVVWMVAGIPVPIKNI